MRGRARRRQDKARMKAKAVRIYGRKGYGMPDEEAAKLADHLHPCSCAMGCGHARKLYGVTRAEEFADMKMQEEIDEALAEPFLPGKRISDDGKEEARRSQGEAA